MKSLVVDTNVFVRLFLGDIPEQVEIGKELLRKAKRQEIELIVPQAVIFEINFILDKVYKFSKEEIIDKLEAVVGANYLQVQDRESLQEGLRLFRENNLSFVDCFLFALAEKENAELFTFDKKLEKLSKTSE